MKYVLVLFLLLSSATYAKPKPKSFFREYRTMSIVDKKSMKASKKRNDMLLKNGLMRRS